MGGNSSKQTTKVYQDTYIQASVDVMQTQRTNITQTCNQNQKIKVNVSGDVDTLNVSQYTQAYCSFDASGKNELDSQTISALQTTLENQISQASDQEKAFLEMPGTKNDSTQKITIEEFMRQVIEQDLQQEIEQTCKQEQITDQTMEIDISGTVRTANLDQGIQAEVYGSCVFDAYSRALNKNDNCNY